MQGPRCQARKTQAVNESFLKWQRFYIGSFGFSVSIWPSNKPRHVISVPGRERQKDQKFKVVLCHTVSLRLVWATRDPVSQTGEQTRGAPGVELCISAIEEMRKGVLSPVVNAQSPSLGTWWGSTWLSWAEIVFCVYARMAAHPPTHQPFIQLGHGVLHGSRPGVRSVWQARERVITAEWQLFELCLLFSILTVPRCLGEVLCEAYCDSLSN